MGHISHMSYSLNQKAHLRKAMIRLIKKKNIISFLTIEWSLFVKTSPISGKTALMGLEKILKFRQSIFDISLLSTLGKGAGHFIWTNITVRKGLNILSDSPVLKKCFELAARHSDASRQII